MPSFHMHQEVIVSKPDQGHNHMAGKVGKIIDKRSKRAKTHADKVQVTFGINGTGWFHLHELEPYRD
jgi:hypothetical protein